MVITVTLPVSEARTEYRNPGPRPTSSTTYTIEVRPDETLREAFDRVSRGPFGGI